MLTLACALTLTFSAVSAQDANSGKYTDPTSGYVYALDPSAALPDALKPAPPAKKKKGPVRQFFKGVGKELGTSFSDMGKDMVFVFSVQDIDPYEKHPDGTKPYELMRCRWLDGSDAAVVRYPDGSLKMQGGFSDGTVAVPTNPRTFIIYYPNGAKGKMEKLPGGGAKVFRPDNSVTTIARNASGTFSISNDKNGWMGSASPDSTGLRYEMSSGSF